MTGDRKLIKIWQPRYRDDKVLVLKSKVKRGPNYLTFTDDNRENLNGRVFRFLGERVFITCSLYVNPENPSQVCYEIPMAYLQEVEDVKGNTHENDKER